MRQSLDSPRSAVSTMRLQTVLSSCHSLREDLGSSWRLARFGISDSIAVLQTAKKDLVKPPPNTWKSDPNYQKVRKKIKDLTVFPSERTGDLDSNRGAQTDRPHRWEDVEETHLEPRPFGLPRSSTHPDSTQTFLRRQSTQKDMELFLKSEINKYNDSRLFRYLPSFKANSTEFTEFQPSTFNIPEEYSPLQRFVLRYEQLKQHKAEQFQENRRQKQESKMKKVVPSQDVARLSEKYLPKQFKAREKTTKRAKKATLMPKLVNLERRIDRDYLDMLFESPEEGVYKDMQRECQDRDHILLVESILNKKDLRSRPKVKRNFRLRI